MFNAIILDLPDELYSALGERAAGNNRSIEAEIIDILESVVLHKNA
jgi:plasmid stability protein